jgi:predicted nuclease of restriction endonuclease-like (RecB) superfamily
MSQKEKHTQGDFEHIVHLISDTRNRVYAKVNEELVILYFNVGKIVSEKVNAGVWGQGTVDGLADYIGEKLPGFSGFNRRSLYRMKQFYESWCPDSACFLLYQNAPPGTPVFQFVSPPATQLQPTEKQHIDFLRNTLSKISWSNHLEVISGTKNASEKLFYLLKSAEDNWSKLELRRQMQSKMYWRWLNAHVTVPAQNRLLPPGLFRDPYLFEFLNLKGDYSEQELEQAILKNLQQFILEIGKAYTYVGNQVRLRAGIREYKTDLLFFHRDLKCLVLFELKTEPFQPEMLGKINFYLEALDEQVRRPGENQSMGILLCRGKDPQVVNYATARNGTPAFVAEYHTRIPASSGWIGKLKRMLEIEYGITDD